MTGLERRVGLWIHRRLVASPVAHAMLLDQYRGAEEFAKRRPTTVCPHLLPEGRLRERYVRHQADEARHEALYAAGIRFLGQTPSLIPPDRDYLARLSDSLAAAHLYPSAERLSDQRPLESAELAGLLALQVVAEERGLEELALHREACAGIAVWAVALVDDLWPDEVFHAAYSLQEMRALDSAIDVTSLLDRVRATEARIHGAVTRRFLDAVAVAPSSGISRTTAAALRCLGFFASPAHR